MSLDNTVNYPIPSYRFLVTVGGEQVSFTSVSGLDISYDTIEYRDGMGNYFAMPGQRQSVSIVLTKGVFAGKNELYDWINTIHHNEVEKKDVLISLTNETRTKVLMSWNVSNAFPTALSCGALDATSNEIAVQELTLMADRVTVQAV